MFKYGFDYKNYKEYLKLEIIRYGKILITLFYYVIPGTGNVCEIGKVNLKAFDKKVLEELKIDGKGSNFEFNGPIHEDILRKDSMLKFLADYLGSELFGVVIPHFKSYRNNINSEIGIFNTTTMSEMTEGYESLRREMRLFLKYECNAFGDELFLCQIRSVRNLYEIKMEKADINEMSKTLERSVNEIEFILKDVEMVSVCGFSAEDKSFLSEDSSLRTFEINGKIFVFCDGQLLETGISAGELMSALDRLATLFGEVINPDGSINKPTTIEEQRTRYKDKGDDGDNSSNPWDIWGPVAG